MSTGALTESERSAILEDEVRQYVSQGFRLTTRTATTAQLVRPKTFSAVWAILWFLVFGVGVLVYILYYMGKRDDAAYLAVGPDGEVMRRGASPTGGGRQQDAGRWTCAMCGYQTSANRPRCKRCQAERPETV